MEASTLVKTVVTTRQEDVEAPLAVEKEPWQLPKSIFAARAKRGPQQSDAKDYFDTPKVLESMFEADWAKLMGKVRCDGTLRLHHAQSLSRVRSRADRRRIHVP